MKKHKGWKYEEGWRLVPHTSGKILDGVYLNKKRGELTIRFAWGANLIYKPIDEADRVNIVMCKK